jgi:hypothetical protein
MSEQKKLEESLKKAGRIGAVYTPKTPVRARPASSEPCNRRIDL